LLCVAAVWSSGFRWSGGFLPLWVEVGGFTARAELSCLYIRAGRGPAQDVVWSAGTLHALVKALDFQAAAVRKILPVLKGEGAGKLLRECHGK
jgi:hypothetical protein